MIAVYMKLAWSAVSVCSNCCCGASVASEQHYKHDFKRIYAECAAAVLSFRYASSTSKGIRLSRLLRNDVLVLRLRCHNRPDLQTFTNPYPNQAQSPSHRFTSKSEQSSIRNNFNWNPRKKASSS